MAEAPEQASQLRDLARQHPNDRNSFGPPPRQQLFSGMRWDRTNEFWYKDPSGAIYLYSNTDDFYVYFWKFDMSGEPAVNDHGLIDCS